MGFLDKLFGRKTAPDVPRTAVATGATVQRASSADPAKDPNMIRVFDASCAR